MSEREHLAQAERLIAECKNRIARQREVIAKSATQVAGQAATHFR
jgi:hypothetical protein